MPAVVTVASGGLSVVEVVKYGLPVTEAANGRGLAVTKVVGKPGLAVVYAASGAAPPLLSPTNMTANNLPVPFVTSASNEYAAGYEAFQAFSPTGYWSTTGVALPQWIQIDLGSTKTCASYSTTTRSDGVFRQWITWTLSGSPDGSTWTVVDTRVGIAAVAPGVTRSYVLSAPQTYRYWRWTVLSSGYDNNGADCEELRLYGP